MKDELCKVCGITYVDTAKPSAKWAARHMRHRQRQMRRKRGRKPTPNCEWAREANRLYHADYHGRNREMKRATAEKPSDYVSAASVCDVCGITADAAPSQKFRTRHQRAGSPPCDAAIESRRAQQQRPRQRARDSERKREQRQRKNREREAGLMPDHLHGTAQGSKVFCCKCELCRAWSTAHSAAQRRKRAAEAAERRASLAAEIEQLPEIDEEELELERRLAS